MKKSWPLLLPCPARLRPPPWPASFSHRFVRVDFCFHLRPLQHHHQHHQHHRHLHSHPQNFSWIFKQFFLVCFAHLTNSIRRTRGPPPYLSLSLPSSFPSCPSRTLKISQQEAFSVVMPIYLETRAFISTHLIGSRVYLLSSHRPSLTLPLPPLCRCFRSFSSCCFFIIINFPASYMHTKQNKGRTAAKASHQWRGRGRRWRRRRRKGTGAAYNRTTPTQCERTLKYGKTEADCGTQEKPQAARAELLEMRSLFLTASGCRTWQAANEAA